MSYTTFVPSGIFRADPKYLRYLTDRRYLTNWSEDTITQFSQLCKTCGFPSGSHFPDRCPTKSYYPPKYDITPIFIHKFKVRIL